MTRVRNAARVATIICQVADERGDQRLAMRVAIVQALINIGTAPDDLDIDNVRAVAETVPTPTLFGAVVMMSDGDRVSFARRVFPEEWQEIVAALGVAQR